MPKHGKKYSKISSQIPRGKIVPVKEALMKIKEFAYAKFDESVDVDISLGIDATKGEQAVRGSVLLPHGQGKQVKVLVFAKGDYAQQARDAGADYVGMQDLIEKIESGWIDFNYAVATPDLMGVVGQLAKILGPKGLLPNKKLGTVTFDVGTVVSDLKKGQAFFKNDKQGLVHFTIGKVSFDVQQLYDNLAAFVKNLSQAKPLSAKGKFLRKMSITSTMGIGIRIQPEELLMLS
jgi:large subunit ribosomal protein L1